MGRRIGGRWIGVSERSAMAVVGLATASWVGITLPALSPGMEISSPEAALSSPPQSLTDLYQLRDQLQNQLQAPQPSPLPLSLGQPPRGNPTTVTTLDPADQLWAVHHRIRHEELAQSLWQQAARQGDQAYALGDATTLPDEIVPVAYAQWQQTLYTLSQVPPTSFVAPAAATQAALYRQQLATLAYRYDTLRSEFLFTIANQVGDASRVRITVCNLQRECRRWQGNRPPANPASLIKVPVAVALMAKLQQEGVDPQVGLWVNPSNWTEDAGWIRVRSQYAVEQVMADMISRSGNVATNQLIDYLGWEGVNQSLQAQGYTSTRITTKLVGDKTYPANRGFAPNQLTTDELTDMMVGIYNQEYPGSDAIQAALANQVDIRLGKTALRPPMIWLGEKTGRNSQVIGSTTAVLIGGKPYIITATLDHSGNEAALRSVMADVAEHILTHHGFDSLGLAFPPTQPPLPSRAFLP
ncbi:MAG: serine hydrolase [Spirulina sp.]